MIKSISRVWLIGILVAVSATFSVSPPASASEPNSDCVIRHFDSTITVATDASVDILEKLTVDCGNLPDKHGIFRILPLSASRPAGQYNSTPIDLISIRDEKGLDYRYTTQRNAATTTWKIGDPDVTITGVHQYLIHYQVSNALYPDTDSLMRLYWNITGNYWELPIDVVSARIVLPAGVEPAGQVYVYEGQLNSTVHDATHLTTTQERGTYIIKLDRDVTLGLNEGITVDLSLPAGAIQPYQPSLWERYGKYFWLLLPLLVLYFCYRLWRRWGDDPNLKLPLIAEYAPPENLRPLELAAIESYGQVKGSHITATIIDLATRGYLTITELPKTSLLGKKDWQLAIKKPVDEQLKKFELKILMELFSSLEVGQTTTLSDHQQKFYAVVSGLSTETKQFLEEQKILDRTGLHLARILFISMFMGVIVVLLFVVTSILTLGVRILLTIQGRALRYSELKGKLYSLITKIWQDIKQSQEELLRIGGRDLWLISGALIVLSNISVILLGMVFILNLPILDVFFYLALGLSLIALVVTAILLPRRTEHGAKLLHHLKGFQLYLKTAEKYRMEFYEKENIFEKYLPYAVAFGLVSQWIAAFQKIYAEHRGVAQPLAWYIGSSGQPLSADNFDSRISELSSRMSQDLTSSPSSSGSSGGGSSGGGGGGGGGGSW